MEILSTLDEAQIAGKRVLLRVDFNVPIEQGKVKDATRIDRTLPTLREIAWRGAKVIVLSHLGRPQGRDPKASLRPVAAAMASALGRQVAFCDDCVGDDAMRAAHALAAGEVLLLENTRFHPGEEQNNAEFAKALAANGEIFVNDAFSASHRAHASTEGLARILPAYAGRAMQAEIEALRTALVDPEKPVTAIVGGSKISTKLPILKNLVSRVDNLIVGGAMACTFLLARGAEVGRSLVEHDLAGRAREILSLAQAGGCKIVLPVDAACARQLRANSDATIQSVEGIPAELMILDIGPQSTAQISEILARSRTLLWNGPLGAFETAPFDKATVAVARLAAELTQRGHLNTVAGGGDTVAALNAAGVTDQFTYVSTAGGAFLEWLEGRPLPGVAVLMR